MSRGIATLEVLIALAVFAMTLIAISLLTFGTTNVLANTEANRHALSIGSSAILREIARGHIGFDSGTTSNRTDERYTHSLSMDGNEGGMRKRLTSIVSWIDTWRVRQDISLEGYLFDYGHARKDACSPILIGNWYEPSHQIVIDTLPPIAAADSSKELFVVTASTTKSSSDPALFVFGREHSGAIQPNPVTRDPVATTTTGYIDVTTGGEYVYALTAETSCVSTRPCPRMEVLSVTGSQLALVAIFPLPPARSIEYHDGRVYIGLRSNATEPEFLILDVMNPVAPTRIGSADIGDTVNDIAVHRGMAYVVTTNNSKADAREVMSFDISMPHSGMLPTERMWPGGGGIAQQIAIADGIIYLGRSFLLNSRELYLLGSQTISSVLSSLDTESGIAGLAARGFLLITLTKGQVEYWNIDTPTNPIKLARKTPLPPQTYGSALTCSGNWIYAIANSATKGYVTAITGSGSPTRL